MESRISKITIILILDILLLVGSFFSYRYIYGKEKVKATLENEGKLFTENNEEPVFSIDKIVINSSAYAVDNSDGNLQSIDISQFSDILVYINNKNKSEELTAENTINEMYIDNIKVNVESTDGQKSFNYKNPLNVGKYVELSNYQEDGILFKIINTNQEESSLNYDDTSFFTDCSNPISLGFVNKNILTGCTIDKASKGTVGFDGSILGLAGLDLKSLSPKISFTIHIVNNYNENFICAVSIDNDLTENNNAIYSGNMIKIINTDDESYNFLKTN